MIIKKIFSIPKILTLILSIGLLFAVIGCMPSDDEDAVLATGLTVQGTNDATTITTHAGTLRFISTITPTNATNHEVTWSVLNGSGSATISEDGVLTAVTNGTVTVKATSKGTPSVHAEKVITISNQVTDNTAPLASAIVEAQLNMNSTEVGTSANLFVKDVQWVLAADFATYTAAIVAAQLTLAGAPLTNAEVSSAVTLLNQATTTFNAAKKDGTKVVLAIDLGTANDFAILSKTGISTTGVTSVTGNIGISPATASYITGFALTMDSGNEFSTSSLVTGSIYASDYLVATPAYLTTAISDMQTAYTDGAGRTADYTELYTGNLSGKTLSSGVYMFSNDVLINTDLTLHGTATDVFIFQIAGTLTMAANTQIILTGGLLPEHVFFVVADTVAIGVGANFYGIILAMTNVSMNTGSTITGMIYAQTSISLDATVVTKP